MQEKTFEHNAAASQLSNSQKFLMSPAAIRLSCQKIFDLALQGETHFDLHLDELDRVANWVANIIRARFPDLMIPIHSRLRHFSVAGIDRWRCLPKPKLNDSRESARQLVDLVIVSVLTDAGAGPNWKYHDRISNEQLTRSEGLAVASLNQFCEGLFANQYQARVDAEALAHLPEDSLAHGLQCSTTNNIVGLSGRVTLLNNLGKHILANSDQFPGLRPGGLVDYIADQWGDRLSAATLLEVVLLSLGPIWPNGYRFQDFDLGDAWPHPSLRGQPKESQTLVVFHKLSQWLTYSLVEPLLSAGIVVDDLDQLTGLAEYRNGGLLIDQGIISLKDEQAYSQSHQVGDPLVVEWRALTITILDLLADRIRQCLGEDGKNLSLGQILEGGTWLAGRKAGREKRGDGTPPLTIISDGTVF